MIYCNKKLLTATYKNINNTQDKYQGSLHLIDSLTIFNFPCI